MQDNPFREDCSKEKEKTDQIRGPEARRIGSNSSENGPQEASQAQDRFVPACPPSFFRRKLNGVKEA
jgi:hypothetical protein